MTPNQYQKFLLHWTNSRGGGSGSSAGEENCCLGVLSSGGKIVEELLNPTNTSSLEEAPDSEEASPVSLAEGYEVVKKVLGGRALAVDGTCPEMLKALDIFVPVGDGACGVADRAG